jgi:hypothetical protein
MAQPYHLDSSARGEREHAKLRPVNENSLLFCLTEFLHFWGFTQEADYNSIFFISARLIVF